MNASPTSGADAVPTAPPPALGPPRALPLHDFHLAHGARMEPFAGVAMPIHYAPGILAEHRHTRAAAGLFDVSHMGQLLVRARSGNAPEAARALETVMPIDVVSLRAGRQRYGLLTSASGGVRDDLMIANLGGYFHLVVNAACAAADLAHLREALAAECHIEVLADRALFALQGPDAAAVLATLTPVGADMRFMDARTFLWDGAECFISRSGYTGEDGFEISLPAARAAAVAARLIAHPAVRLIGLGARDSLRLEAGLCLYGHELSMDTTPVEAALEWAIPAVRRSGGARAGGFPGEEVILAQFANGAARRRVGLRPSLRPVRAGAPLYADAASPEPIGEVTSGTFGPSVGAPVAMAYVARPWDAAGAPLFAEVRGQRTPVAVSDMPFIPHRYQR